MKKNYTLGFAAANGYALLLAIPIIAVIISPYAVLYGWQTLAVDMFSFVTDLPLLIVAIILGTVAHELIHAVCWSWFDDIPWSKIHFGFKWKTLTPYVHCPEPVEVSNYRWGVAMPGLVLGILPFLLALLFKNGWLLGFGLFFTLAAAGDIMILWLLRNVEKGKMVEDHPEEVGCIVIDNNEDQKA